MVNGSCVASVIAVLTLALGVNGPLGCIIMVDSDRPRVGPVPGLVVGKI